MTLAQRQLPHDVPLTDETPQTKKDYWASCGSCSCFGTDPTTEPPELAVLRICVRNESGLGGFVPVMYLAPWHEPDNRVRCLVLQMITCASQEARTESGVVLGRFEDADFDDGVVRRWRDQKKERVTFAARFSSQFAKDANGKYVAIEFSQPGTYCVTLEGHWQRLVVASVTPSTGRRLRVFDEWADYNAYMNHY